MIVLYFVKFDCEERIFIDCVWVMCGIKFIVKVWRFCFVYFFKVFLFWYGERIVVNEELDGKVLIFLFVGGIILRIKFVLFIVFDREVLIDVLVFLYVLLVICEFLFVFVLIMMVNFRVVNFFMVLGVVVMCGLLLCCFFKMVIFVMGLFIYLCMWCIGLNIVVCDVYYWV